MSKEKIEEKFIVNPVDKMRDKIISNPTTLDVITSLMDDTNIEMKTEIVNPYALTVLMTIADYLNNHNDTESYEIIKYWCDKLLKYMVSNGRMSRKEITEILKGYFALERDKEKQVSLTSNLAKINQQSTF